MDSLEGSQLLMLNVFVRSKSNIYHSYTTDSSSCRRTKVRTSGTSI
jgi:hypothetical protein